MLPEDVGRSEVKENWKDEKGDEGLWRPEDFIFDPEGSRKSLELTEQGVMWSGPPFRETILTAKEHGLEWGEPQTRQSPVD